MDQDFPLTGRDRVLVLTSPGFDVSVWETLGPLGSGAALVVPPYTSRTDVEGLRRLITDEQVTVFQTVPSLLQALLDAPGAVGDTALRLIVCGGEEMPPRLAERVRAELPGVTLVNAYGPTETTVDATRHPVTAKDGRSLRVPIGGPVGGGRCTYSTRRAPWRPRGPSANWRSAGRGSPTGIWARPDGRRPASSRTRSGAFGARGCS